MKQIAVIGLGRFGTSVARTLYAMGHDVLVVDQDEEKVQELANLVTHAVQADTTDEAAVRALGIRNFDVVIVSIGQDIQASILTTMIVKNLGVKMVVAKAQNDLHGKVLEKVGADRVIYPERDMGIRLAKYIAGTNILDFIELSSDFSIVEVEVPPQCVGKTLRQLDLRARHGISVIAIRRGEAIKVLPQADDVLATGDILVAMGRTEHINSWEKIR